ncbi:MAG: ATP-dependent DNA helicase RecG [Thermaerobacter sp.]|nr:ATP-dependent DNA helicase RecG [Thermaerobacter sp.]
MDGDRGAAVALGDPITKVAGIGPRRAEDFRRLGIERAGDLLTLWPRRHLDRAAITPIWQVRPGETFTILGHISQSALKTPPGRQPFLRVVVQDPTGSLVVSFFHAGWLKNQLTPGQKVLMTGRVDRFGRNVAMAHPDFELLQPDEEPRLGLVPVYPLAGGLRARFMQQTMQRLLPGLAVQAADPLPPDLIRQEDFPTRSWAVQHLHFPHSQQDREQARRRLVFDEFLRMSLAVLMLHGRADTRAGQIQDPDSALVRKFMQSLPFALTPGQTAVWKEISEDLSSPRPMARLLQGDVGSGKTIIAALTMLAGLSNNRQAAFMAPTELLAEQQHVVLSRLFASVDIEVGLLTGRGKSADLVRDDTASGKLRAVVGTQALVSQGVRFDRLGVVIVDEQHRFGVRQRAELSEKGIFPDMLVMTATPIPRTLALTVYGDLEVSRIEGLPPGRQPIQTVHISSADRRVAYQAVRDRVRMGQQAYVVCPLVDENEALNAKAAVDLAEGMRKIPGWRIGLVHGQMPLAEKTRVMGAFRQREFDVLVATTIIEVGVDVPNASMMVIEQAERFGLAQLHQLRGRVGRGAHASTCYLISDPKTEDAEARIQAMVETQDGLALAERDLEIRGPGEVLGMRQHGVAGFELANPLRDLTMLERARVVARKMLTGDPRLNRPEHANLRQWVREAIDEALPGQVLH